MLNVFGSTDTNCENGSERECQARKPSGTSSFACTAGSAASCAGRRGPTTKKLNNMKVLLLAVLGHGGKDNVLLAMMAAVVVAVAKAQAWHMQLLLRGHPPTYGGAPILPPEGGGLRSPGSSPKRGG